MASLRRALTIGDLMNTESGRQSRASGCNVEFDGMYHELVPETILDKFKALFKKTVIKNYNIIFKFTVTSESGHKHKIYIKTTPDFNLKNWASNKAQIYCDCADFKFRSAYRLNEKNSLFLNDNVKMYLGQSLTTPPKREAVLMCKHAYAAILWLINNYSSIMKTI